MRIPRIFQGKSFAPSMFLDEAAGRHLISVLRFSEGDKLILFNGDGLDYPATIIRVKKLQVEVQLSEPVNKDLESPLKIFLGQAISKGDRMDLTLQKATELGVTEIFPLNSSRSEVHIKGEREIKKMQHWQKVLQSSCEQCGRSKIPLLHKPMAILDWIKYIGSDLTHHIGGKVLLDHRSTIGFKGLSLKSPIYLLAGPEGGFSEEESDYAKEYGFTGVSLGPRVLRTETAALAAITALQLLYGDF